jgi:hypothetical protein
MTAAINKRLIYLWMKTSNLDARGWSMTRNKLLLISLIGAAICGSLLFVISDATVVPLVAKGAGPGGVQVTTPGWASFVVTLLGTLGFTSSSFILWIVGHIKFPAGVIPSSGQSVAPTSSPLPELAQSFAAYMADKTNRAAQRRFVFALIDSASLIQGVTTSHENGVIVFKYSGYADPTPPAAPVAPAVPAAPVAGA